MPNYVNIAWGGLCVGRRLLFSGGGCAALAVFVFTAYKNRFLKNKNGMCCGGGKTSAGSVGRTTKRWRAEGQKRQGEP